MTKFITGILICTLFFCSKVTWAEESSERLKDISKAVSNQLLRMKQDKAGTSPIGEAKKIPEKSELEQLKELELKQTSEQSTKKTEPLVANEALLSEDKVPPSTSKSLEKESKVLVENKEATTKSVELEVKQVPATNLQLNNMLRQQIENIVDTTPE